MATSTSFVFSAAALSQEIEWTWTENRATGYYADGQPWVVGPITLQTITRPQGVSDRDGSMYGLENLAQWGQQGFDVRGDNITYDDSINIANDLPLLVPINKSIISSISRVEAAGNTQLSHQAILTVVETAPAAGSFRPGYSGTRAKTPLFNVSDIDYTQRLTLGAGPFDPADIVGLAEAFRYPVITLGNNYPGIEYFVAKYNTPNKDSGYGAGFAAFTGYAFTELNHGYTDEDVEDLMIHFIQLGLDIYENVLAGAKYPSSGGHNAGRRSPVVFAAKMLQDATMMANVAAWGNGDADNGNAVFMEDQSTFWINQRMVDTPRWSPGYPADAYTSGMITSPPTADWGPGEYPHNAAGSNWDRGYRGNVFPYLVQTALMARLMGAEEIWNHPPFFSYCLGRFAVIQYPGAPAPPAVADWYVSAGTAALLSEYGGLMCSPVTFSRAAATYESPITDLVMATSTGGADIHYELATGGGTPETPTSASTPYTSPITVSVPTTIKAVAILEDFTDSVVATRTFTIDTSGRPASPGPLVIEKPVVFEIPE